MFITKKHLPRRTFLRGVGATIALPFLESMLPAQTPVSQTAANPNTIRRFVGVWHPHGAAPGYWSPLKEGKDFDFSFITKPLEPYRDSVVLITGLDATAATPTLEEPAGDHARGACIFSGARPRRNAVSPYLGVTVDQLIAQKWGQNTILSSLQLGVEDTGNFGSCNFGYSCAYSNCVSWPTPTQPLPTEVNPRVAFERLFGDGTSPEERTLGRKQNASILDSVTHELSLLKKDLGNGDKARIDTYTENIREIERRLHNVQKASDPSPDAPVPFGMPESFTEHIKLMWDLQTLAFQADITRVSTLMYAHDVSMRSYPESGVTTANHAASHHGAVPKKYEDWAKINRYHIQCLTYFLDKLKATPDGDGTLLDHTLILWASNMGDSNLHSHKDVGHMLIGGANGQHKGGRHIRTEGSTANLLLTTLQMFGIEKQSLGDSTGPLSLS